jgi:hypothetical protein
MLLRSAPVQAAFDVWDADKTDQQPVVAPSEACADADATSELTAADIVEVQLTDLRAAVDKRRPRITRVRPPSFERAKEVLAGPPTKPAAPAKPATPAKPSKLPVPLPPPTRRTVPPVSSAPALPARPPLPAPAPAPAISNEPPPERVGPTSIAPMAIDLDTPFEPLPPTQPARQTFESMNELERAAGLPQRSTWQKALTLGVTGLLVALSIASALALRKSPQPLVVATPHLPTSVAAREATIIPVATAASKDELDLDEPSTATIAAPLRSFARASVTTATATMSRPLVGTLRLSPSVRGLLVDGAPHRVDHGVVSLPCGTHRIKTPSRPARTVMVACGGTTVL